MFDELPKLIVAALLGLLLILCPACGLDAGETDLGSDCVVTWRALEATEDFGILVAGCEARWDEVPEGSWLRLDTVAAERVAAGEREEALLRAFDDGLGVDGEEQLVLAAILDHGDRLEVFRRPGVTVVAVHSEHAYALLFGRDQGLGRLTDDDLSRIASVVERRITAEGLRLLGEAMEETFRRGLAGEINEELGAELVDDVFLYRITISEPV